MAAPTWVACSRAGKTRRLFMIAASGESVVDKLSFTPARTTAPQLIVRGVSAAASSVYAHWEERETVSPFLMASTAAISAILVTFATFHLRRWAGQRLKIPDVAVACAEDLLVQSGGAYLFRKPLAPQRDSPAFDRSAA